MQFAPVPAIAEVGPMTEAQEELLAAAKRVLAGLDARIDAAPSNAKPVFDGIADLHDAIHHVEHEKE